MDDRRDVFRTGSKRGDKRMITILIRYDESSKEEVECIKKGLKKMQFDTLEPTKEEKTTREFWIKG